MNRRSGSSPKQSPAARRVGHERDRPRRRGFRARRGGQRRPRDARGAHQVSGCAPAPSRPLVGWRARAASLQVAAVSGPARKRDSPTRSFLRWRGIETGARRFSGRESEGADVSRRRRASARSGRAASHVRGRGARRTQLRAALPRRLPGGTRSLVGWPRTLSRLASPVAVRDDRSWDERANSRRGDAARRSRRPWCPIHGWGRRPMASESRRRRAARRHRRRDRVGAGTVVVTEAG